jgi:imidazolonepropionase-like amidohydrolase
LEPGNLERLMLYKNGRIFDGKNAAPAGFGVLVEDGLIRAIGPEADFDGYAGPKFDLGGDTLMPGLIDCHVHLTMSGDGKAVSGQDADLGALTLEALENAQKALRGGITAVRDCGGVEFVEFAVRDACNSGRFVGPFIRVSGKIICMTGGTKWKVGRVADGPEGVVQAVREQIYRGCDCIKLMATGAVLHPGSDIEDPQYTVEELAAGVTEAERFRRPSAAHAIGTKGILNAARAGVTSIEHGTVLNEEAVEIMLEKGTYLVPTLAALEQVLLHPERVAPASMERAMRVADKARNSVAMFYKAGGKIAMGADTGTLCNPHGNNARELTHMVNCGMKPVDALRSGTSIAADLLRLPTRGVIASGNVADMLIVRGDPLVDIESAADKGNHRLVIKDGKVVAGVEA